MDSFPNSSLSSEYLDGRRMPSSSGSPIPADGSGQPPDGRALLPSFQTVLSERLQSVSVQGAKEDLLIASEEARMRREIVPEDSPEWYRLTGEMVAFAKAARILDKVR
jgi:hypothetical protein